MFGDGEDSTIPIGKITLQGRLAVPEAARGIVLFAHGTGSSRHSPRNRFVARSLREYGLATLLFDLLTSDEETLDRRTREHRFDIDLLAERLDSAANWAFQQEAVEGLSLGYFGASTGAAAALTAAGNYPRQVDAVVSRGGRPDLSRTDLSKVDAPTLLIIGERDKPVIEMNQTAYDKLTAEKEMKIVPNATHLFEEPGALEEVARLAGNWFREHLLNGR